jgi:hypothetical protein
LWLQCFDLLYLELVQDQDQGLKIDQETDQELEKIQAVDLNPDQEIDLAQHLTLEKLLALVIITPPPKQ